MTRSRRRPSVEKLYHAALERPEGEREAFLARQCGEDHALRRDVESLIGYAEEAKRLLERPASEAVTREPALFPGARVGRYEIAVPVGSGGMGEVYRARDTRLDRDVAIKVLPTELCRDPERLQRFEREARAAGALNHPNVLDVHDVGTHEGSPYLVCELLEGETLRERLRAGPLPVREAVASAIQIARGLAAAHERGLVHRDVKPENLFLTRDGRIKILDFGLVKRTGPAAPPSAVPASVDPTSGTGAVLGTVGYMSPEQVRAGDVDPRSDVFALGAVLYEMLSGRRAFSAETAAETLTAILGRDPPALTSLGIPPGLARIAERCLDKAPERRFQSAADVAFALEAVSDAGVRSGSWRRPAAVLVAVALAIGGSIWLVSSDDAAPEAVPAPRLVVLTSEPGLEDNPALSPDGSRIAYRWNGGTGDNWDIYVRQVGVDAVPLRLTRDPGRDQTPAWSPDGTRIAFARRTGAEVVYLEVPGLGGPERRLHSVPDSPPSAGGGRVDWSPDGRSLAIEDLSPAGSEGILLLSLDTLETEPLVRAPVVDHAFSPDGERLAFIGRNPTNLAHSDVYVVSAAGGEPRRLTFDRSRASGVAWTRDGREIVFSSDRTGPRRLWRVAVSGREPVPVSPGGEDAEQLSTARAADRLAYVRGIHDYDIWRIDRDASGRDGAHAVPVIDSTAGDQAPHLSPDGTRIAVVSARSGPQLVWICPVAATGCVRLSPAGVSAGSPRWSPTSREVAFDSAPDGNQDVFVADVETRITRRLTGEASEDVQPSWSRDGRWIYFGSNRGGAWQVWKAPAGGGAAVQVTSGGGFRALEAPDGAFLYFTRTFRGHDVWRKHLPDGEEAAVTALPHSQYCWDVAEDGLYYLDTRTPPGAVERFDPSTGQTTRVAELPGATIGGAPNLTVTPDGRSIFFARIDRSTHDLMLIDGFR